MEILTIVYISLAVLLGCTVGYLLAQTWMMKKSLKQLCEKLTQERREVQETHIYNNNTTIPHSIHTIHKHN